MKRIALPLAGALLLVGLLAWLPAAAQVAPPDRIPQPTSPPPPSTIEYLIVLPMPDANTLDVPAGLTPEQANEYARSLTYNQARPVLTELERLQAWGKISGFDIRPDLHAVAVRLASGADVDSALSQLKRANYIAPVDKEAPTCASDAARALVEQVQGLSRLRSRALNGVRESVLSAQATNPSINVYARPGTPSASSWTGVDGSTTPNTPVTLGGSVAGGGGVGGGGGGVDGWTTPNTPVTLRILRGSQVIATASTTSTSSGQYWFYPYYQSCPTSGYDWVIRVGDVVEVTASGHPPVSTSVVNVSAWLDPVANTVAGTTSAGRTAEVRLYDSGSDACGSTVYSQTAATNASGAFSANFTSQVDFNRLAWAYVYARDANGNSTYAWFQAYSINGYFNSSSFWGYLKPEVDFTATLSRTGSITSTYTGKSGADGYYSGWFGDTIEPGDVVSVSGGGVSMQFTATSLTGAALNPATDQATGTTGPGRRVTVYFYKNASSWLLPTACGWSSRCASATADGSGNFTLHAGMDLVRGDYAYIYIYDAEGNYQSAGQHTVPAVSANLSWNQVTGYWRVPYVYVTVILKDSGGTVKGSQTTWIGSSDARFFAYPGTIAPTDKIEVGDGVVTETMTVQNLTARLDGGTGHVSGVAPNGRLLVYMWDFRPATGYWYSYCAETTAAGGAYDVSFGGVAPGAQDYADVWSTGPGGHYTYRYAQAFSIYAQLGSDYVWGYSETGNTAVTLTLKTGATTKAVRTTTAYGDGYFEASLSADPVVTITQGDTLQVQTGDGDSATISVPNLTVNMDAANNRLYGNSPASQPVEAQLRRRSSRSGWYSYYSRTMSSAAGNYSASFSGLYWSRDCSAVQVGGHCTWPVVSYHNPAGHQIWLEGAQPPPVTADSYESDNTYYVARPYAGIQHHTFHTGDDGDWITFTVPLTDVNSSFPYRIETFNLGWGAATTIQLWWWNGTALIYQTGGTGYENRGQGISLEWTPTAPGMYYLEVSPPSSSYTTYCDANYDLLIQVIRARVYLPVVTRNYPP